MNRDLALGLAAVALAAAWFVAADGLPISMLSDAVGPGGVPKAVALVMGGAGSLLALGALRGKRAMDDLPRPAHGRALGLLAILVIYVVLVPLLGYVVAIGVLAAAVAAYAGARGPGVAAFGAGAAALLWLSFVQALGVAFPAGRLFGGT